MASGFLATTFLNAPMASRTVQGARATPAVRTARRVLRQRLDAFRRAVAVVAAPSAGPEAVHRLRVASRRAIAAVTAFRPLVPRHHRRWLKKSVRDVRRAAGEARDLDVLAAHFRTAAWATDDRASQRITAEVRKRQAQARRVLKVAIANVQGSDWVRRAAALLAGIEPASKTRTTTHFVHRRKRRLIGTFLTHLDECREDGRGIHRLRIESKKLRYTLEVIAAAEPATDVAGCLRSLRRLQTRLGQFTDQAAAAERLRHWSRREADDHVRHVLARAARDARTSAKRVRRGCLRWWNASRRAALARQLERTRRGAKG